LLLLFPESDFLYMIYTVKDSPQPHSPLEFGLLNVNSLVNSSSSQSMVVPITLKSAMGSMNTLMPCAVMDDPLSLGSSKA